MTPLIMCIDLSKTEYEQSEAHSLLTSRIWSKTAKTMCWIKAEFIKIKRKSVLNIYTKGYYQARIELFKEDRAKEFNPSVEKKAMY